MKKLLIASLAGAASLAHAIPAGSTVTRTATVTTGSSWADINLQKFNSNLGELIDVTLVLNHSTISGSFIAGSTSSAIVDSAETRVYVRQSSANNVGFTQLDSSYVTVGTTPSLPDSVTNTSRTYSVISSEVFGYNVWNVSSSDYSLFQSAGGGGNVVFQTRHLPVITVIGSNGSFDTTLFKVTTQMSVIYTYSPAVPEASTYGAALGGLALAAAVVRRRKQAK